MKIKAGLILTIVFVFCALPAAAQEDKQPPQCKAIRTVPYPTMQTRSTKQKMRLALLDLCPTNRGMVARPMLPVMINGKPEMFEYDVARVFKNRRQAARFAKENDIKDF